MNVLALDPSLTRAGYAVFSAPPLKLGELVTGSFASDSAEAFAASIDELIVRHEIHFVVAEGAIMFIKPQPRKQLLPGVTMTAPVANQLKLAEIQGCLRGVCQVHRAPLALVGARSWRAKVLGEGWGDPRTTRAEAKAEAKEHCRRLGVPARNHDIAEAVCVGLWGVTCSDQFRFLLYQRKEY